MNAQLQLATPTTTLPVVSQGCTVRAEQVFFSIQELADRWRCSRGTVYNIIRGEKVLDFAAPGRRGKKLVPRELVKRIEQTNTKVWR